MRSAYLFTSLTHCSACSQSSSQLRKLSEHDLNFLDPVRGGASQWGGLCDTVLILKLPDDHRADPRPHSFSSLKFRDFGAKARIELQFRGKMEKSTCEDASSLAAEAT